MRYTVAVREPDRDDARGRPDDDRRTAAVRRLDSSRLLGEAVEIEIEHQGEVYRLRRTRAGKLILTK